MAQVTELRFAPTGRCVRFAYLPVVGVGLWFSKLLFPAAVISLRINPCAICSIFYRWTEHIKRRRPVDAAADDHRLGLQYENGGEPDAYDWKDIYAVTLHRRNRTRRGGRAFGVVTPPFWLTVTARDLIRDEGEKHAERGYVVPFDEDPSWTTASVAICVWPRQVQGDSLAAFAKASAVRACSARPRWARLRIVAAIGSIASLGRTGRPLCPIE